MTREVVNAVGVAFIHSLIHNVMCTNLCSSLLVDFSSASDAAVH